MGLQDVKDVVRTFGEVFSGHVFFSGADMILVGKTEPWTPAVVGPQSARAALAKLGAPDPLQLRIAKCAEFEGGEILTDDALRLEFSAPKQLDNPEMAAVLDWMLAAWPNPPAPFGDLVLAIRAQDVGDATALGEHLDAAQRAAPQNGFVRRYSGETYLQYVDTLRRDGNFAGALGFLSHARKRLGDDPRLLGALADVLEAKGDRDGALQALRKLRDRVFDSAYLDRRIAKLENG